MGVAGVTPVRNSLIARPARAATHSAYQLLKKPQVAGARRYCAAMKHVKARSAITIGVVIMSLTVVSSGCSKKESTSATTASGAPADTVMYDSTGTTQTLDCASGKSLNVTGDKNTLTVTGTCAELRVGGNGNQIKCAEVTKLVVTTGTDNKITCKAGQASVDDTGGNTIVIGSGNSNSQ